MTNMSNVVVMTHKRTSRLNSGKTKITRKPKKSFFIALAKTTRQFCEETTFHGLRNLCDNARGLTARNISKRQKITRFISTILWLIACGLGISFAVVLIVLVWNRFQSTPTITTIETNNYPIWAVSFPAVTLCNINKVYRPSTESITEKLISRGLTADRVEQFFSNLSKLVQPEYVEDVFTKTQEILTELNYTTEKLMFELMHPCNIMLENCTWLGHFVPCDSIFRIAKSSEGFCCSFNYKSLKDNLEVNSENQSVTEQLEDPIHRVSGAGQFVSLEVLLRVSVANYVAYTRSYYGISVLIHPPEDYPQASATTTIAQPGCEVILAIIPSVVVSEPTVRSLALKQRNCYFDDEKKLRTTEKYSFQSCITECAVDTILKQCGCLPFYYSEIHLKNFAGKIRQCSLQDVGCLRDNRHIVSSLQPPSITNETLGMNCPSCLPSCSEERYSVQSIIAKRFETDNLTSFHYKNKNLSNYVTLKVHFKDVTCLKYRRDIFMTWDGFLASFGGIFGLCLGGSLISFIEIFYFFSLKLYSRFHEMVDENILPEKKKAKEVNIFQISPFPTGKTIVKTSVKPRKHSNVDQNKIYDGFESVSHDKYLD